MDFYEVFVKQKEEGEGSVVAIEQKFPVGAHVSLCDHVNIVLVRVL